MSEDRITLTELDSDRFRGRFLAYFSRIEDHLAPAIARIVELGYAKKPPHLFGQKFDLISKSVDDENIWQHREHVRSILDELRIFVELRGLMGHGLIERATLVGGKAYSIEPPGQKGWPDRKVLLVSECQQLLDSLNGLTAKLLKQGLKPHSKQPKSGTA
jgi:hypothetical protein